MVKRFVSLENRFGGSEQASLVKLVINARSGRVLGAHMMDGAAPEIIQAFAVALRPGVKEHHRDHGTAAPDGGRGTVRLRS